MCHQSVSLIARHLEAAGIPTVIMGCARDIVEHAGVPRFFWSDFPLGHSAGKPHDEVSQYATVSQALRLFDTVQVAKTTHISEQTWATDDHWKADFMSVAHLDEATIAKMQRNHERDRATLAKLKN